MALTWAPDAPEMGLRWAAERLDEAQIVCNGLESTSLVSDMHQICFVDGFELQKAAAAVQNVSVFRVELPQAAAAVQIVNQQCPIRYVWSLLFVKLCCCRLMPSIHLFQS